MSLQVVSPRAFGLLLLIPRGTCTLLSALSPETRDPSPPWATGDTHKGGFSLWPGTLSATVLHSQQGEQSPPPPSADVPGGHRRGGGGLSEDVVGLVLHQHLHAPHVRAPELQAVLHPLDLRQTRTTRVLGYVATPGIHLQLSL